MPPSDDPSTTPDPELAGGFAEPAVVAIGLSAAIAIVMVLSATLSRVTHPMWLDECITSLVANDPSFTHALAAIRGGVENNPPAYYFFLWPLARLMGGMGTVGLRLFAGASMVMALTGIYSVCRLHLSREQAIVGTLAVAAHPMTIAQLFEVRFYGAWLAATAWFVFATLFPTSASNRRRVTFARCVLAVLVATIHWFGLGVVALVVAAHVASAWKQPGERLARALPFGCALLATLSCAPFLIGQRADLTVSTWIDPTTGLTIARLVYRIFVNPSMFVLAAYLAYRLVQHRSGLSQLTRFTPALALLVFPVVITVFSLAVQPTLYDRYVIVVVAPLGVLVAWAALPRAAPGGSLVSAIASLGLLFAAGREMRTYNALVSITDWRIRNAVAATDRIVAHGGPLPVIFGRRFEQYPVLQLRPDFASSVALLDFDGIPPTALMRRTIFERDMARRVARLYAGYRLVNIDALRSSPRFVVISSSDEEDELRRLFAGFDLVRQAPDVYSVGK